MTEFQTNCMFFSLLFKNTFGFRETKNDNFCSESQSLWSFSLERKVDIGIIIEGKTERLFVIYVIIFFFVTYVKTFKFKENLGENLV